MYDLMKHSCFDKQIIVPIGRRASCMQENVGGGLKAEKFE